MHAPPKQEKQDQGQSARHDRCASPLLGAPGFQGGSGIANGGQPRLALEQPGPRIRRPLGGQQQAVRLDEGAIGRPMGTRAGQEIGPQPKGILQHGLSAAFVGNAARRQFRVQGSRQSLRRPRPPALGLQQGPFRLPSRIKPPRKQTNRATPRGHQMPPRHRPRSACGPM